MIVESNSFGLHLVSSLNLLFCVFKLQILSIFCGYSTGGNTTEAQDPSEYSLGIT